MPTVERSSQRRIQKVARRYFTIVSESERGAVPSNGRAREHESINALYHQLSDEQRSAPQAVAMVMWHAYFESPIGNVPGSGSKIAFDRFHFLKLTVYKRLADALRIKT